jgi:hypothetical protein
VKSRTTKRFREAFKELPPDVKDQARAAYRLFVSDPYYPSLRFKKVHPTKPIYSVRINIDYRALGIRHDEEMVWFWIGSHAEYDRLVSQL